MALIEVAHLTKRFGPVVAVNDLSLSIEAGKVVGFLGPNGAGKTTTLRMLLGLVGPSSGTATIDGFAYRELPERSRRVGAVLEASGIHPGRTARGHLLVRASGSGTDAARAGEVLEMVGLADAADRRVAGFSLGMRQRLALAAAMLGDPEVLVLDEPANGLDPEGVRQLRALLRRLAHEGRTVLVSSHVLAEVAQVASEVVILDHGRLVAQSSLDELLARAPQLVHVRSPLAGRLQELLRDKGLAAQLVDDQNIQVRGSTPEAVAALAAQVGVPVLECVAEAAALEDVFLQLTSAHA
ncbi:MAG TPA: ATP-binding cassette domain-containing protein [Acidimicrobiales bacterium]|nr:ATP-binding cassette domain-containing protein [Acidimicrobiales bacterium]